MDSKKQLWQEFCRQNPKFADEQGTVTLTTRGLRKMFDLTWDRAQDNMWDQEEPSTPHSRSSNDPTLDSLKSLFNLK